MILYEAYSEEEIRHYAILEKVTDVPIRNRYGEFLMAAFRISCHGLITEHLALYKDLNSNMPKPPLPVRINSACVTGDVFGCYRCDCKWQLDESLRYIESSGAGFLVYHPTHEGRGSGLVAKLKSYDLMDNGLSTAQAFRSLGLVEDNRQFLFSVVILREFGITNVELLTNNPQKIRALQSMGIVVEKVIPLVMPTQDPQILKYLRSKRDDMGHLFPGDL
jgi:GTP cyclohydrolase II